MVFERNKRFSGFQGKIEKKTRNQSDHQSDSVDKSFPLQFHCNNKLILLFFNCPLPDTKNLPRNCTTRREHICYGVTRNKIEKSER